MKTDLAFRVEHLSKSFEIPTENRNTIKERLMHFRNRLSYDTLKVLDFIQKSLS